MRQASACTQDGQVGCEDKARLWVVVTVQHVLGLGRPIEDVVHPADGRLVEAVHVRFDDALVHFRSLADQPRLLDAILLDVLGEDTSWVSRGVSGRRTPAAHLFRCGTDGRQLDVGAGPAGREPRERGRVDVVGRDLRLCLLSAHGVSTSSQSTRSTVCNLVQTSCAASEGASPGANGVFSTLRMHGTRASEPSGTALPSRYATIARGSVPGCAQPSGRPAGSW